MVGVQQGVKTNVVLYTAAAVLGFSAFAMAVANLLTTVKEGPLTITSITKTNEQDRITLVVAVTNNNKNNAVSAKLLIDWTGTNCKQCYTDSTRIGRIKKGETVEVMVSGQPQFGARSIYLKTHNGSWKESIYRFAISTEVTITATPSVLEPGQSTTLTWSAPTATYCVASGAWSGTKSSADSEVRNPNSELPAYQDRSASSPMIFSYRISCFNENGSVGAAVAPVSYRSTQLYCTNDTQCVPNKVCRNGTCVEDNQVNSNLPDLEIASIKWEQICNDGGCWLKPTALVRNSGQVSAVLPLDKYGYAILPFLFTDLSASKIPPFELVGLTPTVKAIAPGALVPFTINFSQGHFVSSDIGKVFLADVDAKNQIRESNENNNSSQVTVQTADTANSGQYCNESENIKCPLGYYCNRNNVCVQ